MSGKQKVSEDSHYRTTATKWEQEQQSVTAVPIKHQALAAYAGKRAMIAPIRSSEEK